MFNLFVILEGHTGYSEGVWRGQGRCGTRTIIWVAMAIVEAGDGGTLDKAVDSGNGGKWMHLRNGTSSCDILF